MERTPICCCHLAFDLAPPRSCPVHGLMGSGLAEILQIEPDAESAAKLDAMTRRDAWLASIVAACLLLAALLVAGAVGWALRGWIG